MVTHWTQRGQVEDDSWKQPVCYVVTDIETDGPEPGKNSMLSFASVAVSQTGEFFSTFEASLAPLVGAVADPGTLSWLQSQPGAWADATRDPRPPEAVMADYVDWLRALPTQAVFVAHSVSFDGFWIDWYLRRFAGRRLACGPYGGERLFLAGGLDLPTLVMGTKGWRYGHCRRECYPADWFGDHAHNHRAIDDALGYAHFLVLLLGLKNPPEA